MSSTSTPQERDEQLLSIGKQCSHSTCGIVDFLPFKCQHCQQSFCQEHFMVDAHSCPSYDESKHNRIAPNCPLCRTPVSIPPGEDPNIRMEAHLSNDCSVMTGRIAKKSVPVCSRGRCGKVLYVPIRCDKCHRQFCPSHRFPDDHGCSSTTSTAPAKPSALSAWSKPSPRPQAGIRTGALTAGSRLLDMNSKASAAIKKGMASASAAVPSKTAASTIASSSSGPSLFSKADSSSFFSLTSVSLVHSNAPATTKPDPITKPLSSSFVPPPVFA